MSNDHKPGFMKVPEPQEFFPSYPRHPVAFFNNDDRCVVEVDEFCVDIANGVMTLGFSDEEVGNFIVDAYKGAVAPVIEKGVTRQTSETTKVVIHPTPTLRGRTFDLTDFVVGITKLRGLYKNVRNLYVNSFKLKTYPEKDERSKKNEIVMTMLEYPAAWSREIRYLLAKTPFTTLEALECEYIGYLESFRDRIVKQSKEDLIAYESDLDSYSSWILDGDQKRNKNGWQMPHNEQRYQHLMDDIKKHMDNDGVFLREGEDDGDRILRFCKSVIDKSTYGEFDRTVRILRNHVKRNPYPLAVLYLNMIDTAIKE